MGARFFELCSKCFVGIESFGCIDAHSEERMDENAVAGIAHPLGNMAARRREVPVLRRVRGAGHKPAMLWFRDNVGEKELYRLAQHRVGTVTQELYIAGKGVVIPHLQRNPDTSGHEDTPANAARRRKGPWVRDCVHDPSRRAIHLLCSCPARGAYQIDQSEEWCLTLR